MTEVKKCTCNHEEQDKIYGHGMRLFNKANKGMRCTVCARLVNDTPAKK